MRARDRGRALGQILALGAALAVVCTAVPGTAAAEPPAQQQERQQQQQSKQQRVLKWVVVGDSFSAGQGVRGPSNGRVEPRIYFDAADPRHQSTESVAIQAAARLQAANPDIKVEVTIVAASGAATSDLFETQRRDPLETIPGNTDQKAIDQSTWHDQNDLAVNTAQLDQIPADADAVIVGLGGNDVFFGPMVRSLAPGASDDTDAVLNKANPLLDTTQSDQAYRDQADQGRADNKRGYEPTLVARLLGVMQAIHDKVPNAKMFVQNYPMAVDPKQTSFNSPLSSADLDAMGKFGDKVNAAVKRTLEICGCADLIDVSKALAKRELYTRDSAMNDLSKGFSSNDPNWEADEAAHPNLKGAGLMSDYINETVAKGFGLKVAPRKGDRRTDIRNITVKNTPAPDTDGDGQPDYRDKDWDGDGTPNTADRNPNTPTKPQPAPNPEPRPGPTNSPMDRPNNTQPGNTDARPGPSPAQPGPIPAPPPQPAPAPARPQQPSPAPPQQSEPTPAPPEGSDPAPTPPEQSRPAPEGSDPAPEGSDPAPGPSEESDPAPEGSDPAPAPPQESNPAPAPPQSNPTPNPTSGRSNSPVIPQTAPMRSPAAPSMPKGPTAPGFQPSIGPKGSQPPPIARLGTPTPPPVVTVPSPPTKNPYPLGGSKPPSGSSAGGTTPITPPVPERAPAPPPAPPASDSFVGV